MERIERYRGCLLGLAAGDALGTTLEFKRPGSFRPIDDIVGGGSFGLKPGQWTDDTSMALCLAESLIERWGFAPIDQMERYVRWYRQGHLSSTGRCFDIGNATRAALETFERTHEPDAGSTDPRSAGNGSIMRLAPVPLFFARAPRKAIARAADSSRTTHAAVECMDACRYLAALIVGAVHGVSKDELLMDHFAPEPGLWKAEPLAPTIAAIAVGSFKHRNRPDIRGTGYVVESLEAALWAFHRSTSFHEGALLAVNLGDDADTTGAVYGHYVSPDLLAEYREVPEQLRSSGKVTADQRQVLVSGIAAFVAEARVVVPIRPVAICRDPEDNMVLECCRAARASVLITGDGDLLDLATTVLRTAGLQRLAILTPRAFVERALPHGAKKR